MRQKFPLYILLSVLLISTGFSRNYPVEVASTSLLNSLMSKLYQDDTIRKVGADSLLLDIADTLVVVSDTSETFLEFPAFSQARDSVIEDFRGGKKMFYYYGDVKVTYGKMSLAADYMEYDYDQQIVFAKGLPDTNGIVQQHPVMNDKGKEYKMEEVIYNFKTEKARIKNMITTENDGAILFGENLKMMPDKSINMTQGRYTVCDHDHPHYYLRLTAAKIVTEPKQRTVFGPAFIVVEDVPLFPLVLPFGFIPDMPERAGGLLMPTFGEERSRGFYMRELGYYFVLGDYFDVSLTSNIYTLGSWGVDVNSRYKLRYKFNGSFNLTYSVNQTGERGDPDFLLSKDFVLRWSHSQDAKARPGTNFSANVNFSSPSGNRFNNNHSISQAMNNSTSSNITYSKTWTKMNLSLNVLHSQNSRDSSYSITLPNITFNLNRFYPFKKKDRVGKERFYEQISFGYSTTFKNSVNFKVRDFVLGKDEDYQNIMMNREEIMDILLGEKLSTGMNHNFQIGLPQFTLLKYFNFSPSINYGMNWYFQDKEAFWNEDKSMVEYIKSNQFSTFGAYQTLSGSVSMSTRMYGMYEFGKNSPIERMRHMLSPSVSFSFSPSLSGRWNGWEEFEYTDKEGHKQTQIYNRYAVPGGMNSPPSMYSNSANMTFELKNSFEGKVKDKSDTTGTGSKMVKLIDQLNFRSGYDFMKERNKMSDIGVTINTNLFQKLNVSGNMNFSPYALDEKGSLTDDFLLKTGGGLARMTNASVSFSYAFSGKGTLDGNDGANDKNVNKALTGDYYNRTYYHPVTGEYIPGGWVYYSNPNVPWSVNFAYQYSYSKTGLTANHVQTLSINGQAKITKDLDIRLDTGIDLMKMKLTTTRMSATYDLHCFSISFSWTPSGQYQSWSFRIAAKASELADLLKFKKESSYWDN